MVEKSIRRKIRMGMVGGCPGKFICDAHHYAWRLDGLIELVAGSFSGNAERNRRAGETLGIDPGRVYETFEEMMSAEAALPADQRIELVAQVTPNQLHAPVSLAALRAGFPVICDKPLTFSLAEAEEVCRVVEQTGLPFALTHTYAGYPMIKQARDFIADGRLGKIRKVLVEYPQAGVAKGLATGDETRLKGLRDPGHQTDVSACMSDIGVHAAQLAESVSGLEIRRLLADADTIVPGRELDDDAHVLMRFDNDAKGILMASQICAGAENNLSLRVIGEHGALQWSQHDPNTMQVFWNDQPTQIFRTGRWQDLPGEAAARHQRMPAGHPEGYIEAFANIYRNMARLLLTKANGQEPDPRDHDFPTHHDGYRGMALVQAVYDSSRRENTWVEPRQFAG